MNMRHALLACFGLTLVACGSSGESNTNRGATNGDTALGPSTQAPPLDHPAVDQHRSSAGARRLSTDQLRSSLPVVMGNDVNGAPITWTLNNGTPAIAGNVARSLGEPDYIDRTEEALEPQMLYAKFASDAANDVCEKALVADAARAEAKTRVLLRFATPTDLAANSAATIDENLRYLTLRFFGVRVSPSDSSRIAPLRKVFTEASRGQTITDPAVQARAGWKAVCVALLTSPEFHLY